MPTPPILTGQDIAEAQGAVRALLEHVLAPTGATSNEYIALRVLAARGPYAEPEQLHEFLADQRQLELDQAAVGSLLSGLEARGLVTGTAADGPGPAELTEAGSALHIRLAQAVAPTTQRLYADIAPADLTTTHRVLAHVVETAVRLRTELQPV